MLELNKFIQHSVLCYFKGKMYRDKARILNRDSSYLYNRFNRFFVLRFIKQQLQFEHWIDVKIIARRWVFDNVTIFELVNISLCYMSLMWHKIDRLLIQPFIFHRQPPSMNLHDSYYPSTLTSFFSSIAASILSKTLLLIPHIFTVPLCHLCVPVPHSNWGRGRMAMAIRDPAADQMSLSSCDRTSGSAEMCRQHVTRGPTELPDKTSQVQN